MSCPWMPRSFEKQPPAITCYYLLIYTSLHLNKTLKRKGPRQEICFVEAPSKLSGASSESHLEQGHADEQLREAAEILSTLMPCPGEEALINLLIKLKLFALSSSTHVLPFSLLPAGSSSERLVLQLSLQYSPKGLRGWGDQRRREAKSSLLQWCCNWQRSGLFSVSLLVLSVLTDIGLGIVLKWRMENKSPHKCKNPTGIPKESNLGTRGPAQSCFLSKLFFLLLVSGKFHHYFAVKTQGGE